MVPRPSGFTLVNCCSGSPSDFRVSSYTSSLWIRWDTLSLRFRHCPQSHRTHPDPHLDLGPTSLWLHLNPPHLRCNPRSLSYLGLYHSQLNSILAPPSIGSAMDLRPCSALRRSLAPPSVFFSLAPLSVGFSLALPSRISSMVLLYMSSHNNTLCAQKTNRNTDLEPLKCCTLFNTSNP